MKNLDSQDHAALPALELWLVDDDEHFRRLCVELLEQTKAFQCARQFGSAEEVIEALRHQSGPETMLLDVSMPGLNGAAAVKTIKSLSPGTAVFMFSTLVDPEREAEARAGGASGYLHKSESIEVVVRILRAAVHPLPPTATASV
ncbi:MAG: DNA-binding response regulator [Comamonadaceae bacterium]|nr:MAG: DNA-binding response regulator [Comamonadaceae bacterium]